MPPNTVKVARPGIWGNPFRICTLLDAQTCVRLFRSAVEGRWPPEGSFEQSRVDVEDCYRVWLVRMRLRGAEPLKQVKDLKGFNLACFCGLDRPCHADVLLELANAS